MENNRTYIAIDLKSFYASVECVQRGLDPLKANLVVADESRTEKTICLAVTPSLKSVGIGGRCRLFEAIQKVNEINNFRRRKIGGKNFTGETIFNEELEKNPTLKMGFVIAMPQMKKYMDVSSHIYSIYLRYVSHEDIHVYSIDEVFIDATDYLILYKMSAHDFAMKLIKEVLSETGITATVGIGTNMYLAKVAMDIVAKHIPADEDGVRIAELDEKSYRQKLWTHTPLTDFWRIGKGYYKKLEDRGMTTMGDIARCSIENEDILYKLFGINAELLIDHAWGIEPARIKDIKTYVPQNNSLSSGQVLSKPYSFDKGKLIVREMTDLLVLDMVAKKLCCDQMVLSIGYDYSSINETYNGSTEIDRYGKIVPKQAHGSINLGKMTSSTKLIVNSILDLYESIVNRDFFIRRITVVANHVISEFDAIEKNKYEQITLFDNVVDKIEKEKSELENEKKEKSIQNTIIELKNRYGKNAVLKGMNFEEDATAIERNSQVGGHKA